jgi:hypothetical protein
MLAILLMMTASAGSVDAIDAGDRAWFDGDRATARTHWSAAAESADPAQQAMGEVRLLLVSGNLGMVVHGPRADAALQHCPLSRPECALAHCDYHIMLGLLGLPHDREQAGALAHQASRHLPAPALARLVLLGEAPLSDLTQLDGRDALGDGLVTHGGWLPGPGTWFAGVGISGVPGLGVGGTVQLVHPDVAWSAWSMQLHTTLSTQGNAQLHGAITSPQQTFVHLSTTVQHLALNDGDYPFVWLTDAAPGLGRRFRRQQLSGGAYLRWDDATPAHGGRLAWQGTQGVHRATADLEVAVVGRPHHRARASWTGQWGAVVGHVAAEESLGSQAPWWRQPFAGGGHHLRSAPAFRWQAPWLTAAALEWRQPLLGALGGVVFGEAAWVDSLHVGLGAGLRLRLPPHPHNTVRVDVAWGAEGAVVTAGWGEAF